jgi:hypothetical protein
MSTFHRNRFLSCFSRSRWLWMSVAIFGLTIGTVGAPSAWAQYGMPGMIPYTPRTNRTNNPYSNSNSTLNRGPQPFQGTATITAVGSQGLEVTDATGKTWKLAPERNCVIEVTGTADSDFLKPDMLVRFTAQFDKKGKATSPVNELEIISPQAAMGSIKQEVNGKKEAGESVSGAIIGHIKSIKNNQLTVQNTNGTFTAELGPNPSIKVNLSDFHLAQPGDKVDATGEYSPQGLAGAKEMRITLSNPLGENGKRKSTAKAAGNAAAANK